MSILCLFHYIYIYIYIPISIYLYPYIYIYIYIGISICYIFISISIYLSTYLSIDLPIYFMDRTNLQSFKPSAARWAGGARSSRASEQRIRALLRAVLVSWAVMNQHKL